VVVPSAHLAAHEAISGWAPAFAGVTLWLGIVPASNETYSAALAAVISLVGT
jgi:hypothetical protein